MPIKNAKYLSSYWFRSKTTSGNLCKTYCDVYSNGITIVNQLILTKDPEDQMTRFIKLCSKLGYNLYCKDFGLKYESLVMIAEGTSQVLNEFKVKRADID